MVQSVDQIFENDENDEEEPKDQRVSDFMIDHSKHFDKRRRTGENDSMESDENRRSSYLDYQKRLSDRQPSLKTPGR